MNESLIKNMKEGMNSLYRFVLRVRGKVCRETIAIMNLQPASYPYITGDGFRKISNHIYDEIKKCRAGDIKDGQIVFVKGEMIGEWFNKVHPNINSKYKLITHNSDYNIKNGDIKYIDDKIIRWFAQNVTVNHPKITPIPIGVNNYRLCNLSELSFYNKYTKVKFQQKDRIIFGFTISTNPKERQPAYDYLMKSKIADKIRGKNYPKTYAELIKTYKFIACPNGNGLDDPRRWQALYFGIIPIVTKSSAMDYFKSLGLPFYIIENWNELDRLEEKDLGDIYDRLMSEKNEAPLYFDYWKNIIMHHE